MAKWFSYEYDAIKNLRKRHSFDNVRRKPIKRTGPNTLERKLQRILGPSFTYAGDGSFKIDNLKPDFVNKSRKVVVEVYGNYWHRNESTQETMQRINRLQRQGWRTIIIWESEIADPIKLRRKLSLI